MGFEELVRRVSEEARWPRYQVREVLRAAGKIIPQMVIERGLVGIYGFGTFVLAELSSRTVRPFGSKEQIETGRRPWIKFKPGVKTRRTLARRRKR